MPYAIAESSSAGSSATITLIADEFKNYSIDFIAYSYNSANPNTVGQLTVKRGSGSGEETLVSLDVPDGGVGYIPIEIGADGYDIPMEIKLLGVGTGSSARIGKLSIKYRE